MKGIQRADTRNDLEEFFEGPRKEVRRCGQWSTREEFEAWIPVRGPSYGKVFLGGVQEARRVTNLAPIGRHKLISLILLAVLKARPHAFAWLRSQ